MEYFFYGLAAPVITTTMVVVFIINGQLGKITQLLEEMKELLKKS